MSGDPFRNMGQKRAETRKFPKTSLLSERSKDFEESRKWSSWALGLRGFNQEKKRARPPVLGDESEGRTFSGATQKPPRNVL